MDDSRLVATLAADASRAIEVGIGNRTDIAAGLTKQGVAVTATDVVARDVPEGVRFVRDDVTDPDPTVYADADIIYALNCPPELQGPLVAVARAAGARWAFTTLGGDPVLVDARPKTLPQETLFIPPEPNGRV
ncbi:MAG: UPF0146 family protein [Halobacteriales archaeon]|nr:UPF0146 family protein [Halobacteriales archaeon]